MRQKLKQKLILIRDTTISLLSERSTWQGIGFIVAAFTSKHVAELDWGAAAFVGATISAFMKIWPDKKP